MYVFISLFKVEINRIAESNARTHSAIAR